MATKKKAAFDVQDVNNIWLANQLTSYLGIDMMEAMDFVEEHRPLLLQFMVLAAVDYTKRNYKPPYEGDPVVGSVNKD